MPQIWSDLDSSRQSYFQSPTMTQLWIGSIEQTCTACYVSLFCPSSLKLIAKKLRSVFLQPLFTALQSDAQRESYWTFPMITSLRLNSGAWQSTTFHRLYIQKYCEPSSEIFWRLSSGFQLHTIWISDSEPS